MSDKDHIEEKTYTVDGVQVNVFVGVSPNKKHVEFVMEAVEPLSPLLVAKLLEVIGSNLLRGVYVPPHIYAKELN